MQDQRDSSLEQVEEVLIPQSEEHSFVIHSVQPQIEGKRAKSTLRQNQKIAGGRILINAQSKLSNGSSERQSSNPRKQAQRA